MTPLNLDTDLLRTFVAVADMRGFTAAGKLVARTQSTVSIQIKRLEERLGCRVFERTRRSLRLTPRGETLLGYARRILELNDQGVRAVTQPPLSGSVRLGVTEYFVPQHLPRILAAFIRIYPHIRVQVDVGLTAVLRTRQAAGELDLVIARRECGDRHGEMLVRENLYWVAAAGYRLARTGPVPLIMLPPPCGNRALAIASLDRAKRRWHVLYTSGSILGVHAAVEAGLGITCLNRSAIRPDMRILGAAEGLPKLPDCEIAIFPTDAPQSAAIAALMDIVRESLRAVTPTGTSMGSGSRA